MYYKKWQYEGGVFEFKNSSFDGVEKVFMNGKLMASQFSVFGAKHRFQTHGNKYEVRVRMEMSFGVNITFKVNGKEIFHKEPVGSKISPIYNTEKTKGRKALNRYDVDEAIEAFQSALMADPNDEELHLLLGCCYSLTENVNKALYHIQYYINTNRENIERVKNHEMLAYLRMQKAYEDMIDDWGKER